jgi:TctA family transporter
MVRLVLHSRRPKSSAILASGITVFGVVLFHFLLNIPFPLPGHVATISILLTLTFGMHPVPAIWMLSGVYYGA